MDLITIFTLAMGALGLLVPLCVGGVMVAVIGFIIYYLVRRSQKASAANTAAQSWPTTQGVILVSDTRWVRGANNTSREVPIVVYQYTVGGQNYQGQTIRPGDAYLTITVSGQAKQIAARYPVGLVLPIHYNPSNPAESALEVL